MRLELGKQGIASFRKGYLGYYLKLWKIDTFEICAANVSHRPWEQSKCTKEFEKTRVQKPPL